MMEKKPDATEIEAFVGNLAVNLHLEPARSWWPDYLFHTTELHNVVEILKSGQLLSRAALGEKMRWDNANKEIIDQTPNEVREKVRLYFRPRTPMTFNNEGFRTIACRHRNAYCPLPVVIGFPSLPILTARETIFSGGNCSDKETRTGTTAAFFRSIPFADVYHDTTWPPGEVGIQLSRWRTIARHGVRALRPPRRWRVAMVLEFAVVPSTSHLTKSRFGYDPPQN